VNTHLGDSLEEAKRTARPGHDELRKLIWPNTVKANPALAGRPPYSLEESMASGSYLVGTAATIRCELVEWSRELGLEYLTIFPHFPGMTQRDTLDQLDRFCRDIMPALSGYVVRESIPTPPSRRARPC
jgi:alkanesulfonate monooxygenase SsuD/methylene tetrahydromethanopterin reductase-like flavin-dependent oxidoreductase (luciferase family)